MTELQLKRTIQSAFYRVVRTHIPLSLAEFFDSKIEDTWPTTPPPTDWSDFWYESVCVEIQSGVMARNEFIDGFSYTWLKENKGKKWEALVTHASTNLVPLRTT
jgi:hypothetical protein